MYTSVKNTGGRSCGSRCGTGHLSRLTFSLLPKFIDGRLDLLNSGEGFSDVFEEEINMSEYAGKKPSLNMFVGRVETQKQWK